MEFTKLFEPCRVGKLELPNRIVMPPMTTGFTNQGFVTERMIDYYTERAQGGVGLIIVEDFVIDYPLGHHVHVCNAIDDDKYLPGLTRLVKAIKGGGAKVALNLNHGGRKAGKVENGQLAFTEGMLPVAPSALPEPVTGFVVPRELSIDEIEELENKFVQAALRVREAGFNLLSLHAAHMYLINQFLSPACNKREDIYGGDLNGRLRFLLEIIHKIKEKVGNDYPIMVRINGEERLEGGLTIEDAKEISRHLESAGVDCISVSVSPGWVLSQQGRLAQRDKPTTICTSRMPRACIVHLAAAVKQVVSVPVMTVNRIVTPDLAEEILEQGKADLIGIGRGLIADPEWPKKAKEGREDEIRYCIGCMHCVRRVVEERADLRCAVNAAAGQEAECKITRTAKPKKVFIAGGGPAGLEAARISALRGHRVHLFEKEKLGGQLNMSCIPPGKAEMKLFLDFEERQLNQLGVKVVDKELTSEIVKQEKPDAVIVSCGARPILPSLPGIDEKSVLTAWQVLKEEVTPKGKVVILGGGMVGAETAEYLAQKGNQVTIVEMLDDIATELWRDNRQHLLLNLTELGVKMLTTTTAKKITDNGVMVEHRGKQQFIETDAVVLALGAQPNRELADELKKLGVELYIVGDCAEARRLSEAVEEGFKAALKL